MQRATTVSESPAATVADTLARAAYALLSTLATNGTSGGNSTSPAAPKPTPHDQIVVDIVASVITYPWVGIALVACVVSGLANLYVLLHRLVRKAYPKWMESKRGTPI